MWEYWWSSELTVTSGPYSLSLPCASLRHGSLEGVRFLVDIVPVLMVDFLPPVQVLQMVVTEFVSPHQPRPALAAVVMGEVSFLCHKDVVSTLLFC